jgi:hypothetical protein
MDNGALYSYKTLYDTVSKIGNLSDEFSQIVNSKPLTSFVSFAKKRLGNKTKYDAIRGFLDYIPAASYATEIDPMITTVRQWGKDIEATAKVQNVEIGQLKNYLNEYANSLTNTRVSEFDKVFNHLEATKLLLSTAHLVSNMVKRNLLVGNISTLVAQSGNIVNGFAYTKGYMIPGMAKTMRELFSKKALSNQSPYLRERGFAKEYRRLDNRILSQPINFVNWLTETVDMTVSKSMWNAAYMQGIARKMSKADAIRYADDITRKSTAGRGVGEMPLIYQGKLFNIALPFQLEVVQTLQVYPDVISKRDIMGVMSVLVAAYAMNYIYKETRGSTVTLDLLGALDDATEKDLTPAQRVGRVTGELLTNIPLGQTIASSESLFPKYGGEKSLLGFKTDLYSREKLFGEQDPTRFGEGLLIGKAIQEPQYFLLPPFGGAQIKKTQTAIKALREGQVETEGRTAFTINPDNVWQNLKTALFGVYTSPEGRRYIERDRGRLEIDETEFLKTVPKEQQERVYEELQMAKYDRSAKDRESKIKNDPNLSNAEKEKQLKKNREKYEETLANYQAYIQTLAK